MPFGFSSNKEEKEKLPSNTHPTDSDDLEEISKIKEMLNPDEKVLLVARQSRIKPGGSLHTPNIIYATDRRIIIRDPYMLGIKENVIDIPYDIVTSVKLERGLLSSTIRFKAPGLMSSTKLGMQTSSNRKFAPSRNQKPNELIETKEYTVQSNQSISIADEIRKLAKLKEEGTITEEEFQQMKQDLMRKNRL